MNWKELKDKLKQKFAVLAESDLIYEEGKRDEIPGTLQIKLVQTKYEM